MKAVEKNKEQIQIAGEDVEVDLVSTVADKRPIGRPGEHHAWRRQCRVCSRRVGVVVVVGGLAGGVRHLSARGGSSLQPRQLAPCAEAHVT